MATVEEFKVKVTASGLDNLDKVTAGAEKARAKIDGLSTAILGVGFGAFILGAIEMADRIVDLSDATGISIGNLKAFEDAMGAAGGKSRNAEKAILSLVTAIETANGGSIKVRDAFAAVGISLTDLQNLSEEEIFLKTLRGLSEMESGSARTAVQATLLSKSFRGVEAGKMFEEFQKGQITAEELAASMKLAADQVAEMEKKFKTLQEGALLALDPVLTMLGTTELTAKSAADAIQLVGGVLALAFGASILADIVAINTALGITVGLSNALGKTPLGALAKLGALGVGAVTLINIDELNAKNEKLKASADAASKAQMGVGDQSAAETARLAAANSRAAAGNTGDAKRTQELDARQKAYIESDKRIAQSRSEADKSAALTSFNEIANIRLNAENDITKAIADIKSKEYLDTAQKDREIGSKRLEINAKAEAEIRKIRETNERELNNKSMDMFITTTEGRIRLAQDAAQRNSAISSIELDYQNKKLEAQFRYARLVDADNRDQNKSDLERDQASERYAIALNNEIKLIGQQAQLRKDIESSMSQGAKDRIIQIEESMSAYKTAGMMVDSVFNNMGSSLDRFVETGKLSFGDLARSILIDLEKIALKSAVVGIFKSAGLESLFIPGRAAGGPVSAGSPYIVGEKGPELFIPQMSGSIIPNGSSGGSGMGGGTTIINNISAIDAKSVAQLFAENRMTLFGNVEQARRELPMRTR